MNETACKQPYCTTINVSVFTLNLYSLRFNPFSDTLMTVWVHWYVKTEVVYLLDS